MDVAWVWHAHVLSPRQYRLDCMAVVGVVVVPEGITVPNKRGGFESQAAWKWNRAISPAPPSKIKYDVVAAAKRQTSVWNSVSLPHWNDEGWLKIAVIRYDGTTESAHKASCPSGVFASDGLLRWGACDLVLMLTHPCRYADAPCNHADVVATLQSC